MVLIALCAVLSAGAGTVPPVDSSLPAHSEIVRSQNQVVPAAQPSLETEAVKEKSGLRGRILAVNPEERTISLETDTGPRQLPVPAFARFSVDGQPVTRMEDLPRDGRFEIVVRGFGTGPTIALHSLDTPAGPSVGPPPRLPGHDVRP